MSELTVENLKIAGSTPAQLAEELEQAIKALPRGDQKNKCAQLIHELLEKLRGQSQTVDVKDASQSVVSSLIGVPKSQSVVTTLTGVPKWIDQIPINELNVESAAKWKLEFEKHHGLNNFKWNGCNFTNRATSGKYTNVGKVFTLHDVKVSMYLHQLMHFGNGGEYFDNNAFDISHLCSQPRCGNHLHIVLESRAVNLSRKSCKTVFLDCANCSSRSFYTICDHEPKCCKYIFRDSVDVGHNVQRGTHSHKCIRCGIGMQTAVKLENFMFLQVYDMPTTSLCK